MSPQQPRDLVIGRAFVVSAALISLGLIVGSDRGFWQTLLFAALPLVMVLGIGQTFLPENRRGLRRHPSVRGDSARPPTP